MHLDDQPVGAGGRGRAGQRRDQVAPAGAVARVDHHRQVRQLLEHRHRRRVERVAVGGLEGADAPLAQDRRRCCPGSMYSAAISSSSIVADIPRLSSTGLPAWPSSLEQREVLHVAGADLETSACSATSGDVRVSITSVTTGSPVARARLGQQGAPSMPSPWNEYGEVRGLNAPPRSTRRPPRARLRAVLQHLLGVSTAHGPAITLEAPRRRCSPSYFHLSCVRSGLPSLQRSTRVTRCRAGQAGRAGRLETASLYVRESRVGLVTR